MKSNLLSDGHGWYIDLSLQAGESEGDVLEHPLVLLQRVRLLAQSCERLLQQR